MTRRVFSRDTRRLATGAFLGASLLLGGCFDTENGIRVEPDGALTVTTRLTFDREMQDIIAFAEHMARLAPNPDAAVLASGLCSAINMANASAPPGIQVTARQIVTDTNWSCEARARLTGLPPEIDVGYLGAVTMADRNEGQERRKVVRVDFEMLPDPSSLLTAGMIDQMKRERTLSERADSRDIVEAMEKAKKAAIAAIKITARNRAIELSVSGARIVSTDGEVSPDGRSAKLRMTYAELAEILLYPEKRTGKKIEVVVAY